MIWFHGTNDKKDCQSILKSGFRSGTYFTPLLDTAICYGGQYVFAIFFQKDPTKHWEWISSKPIPKSKILCLKHYSFKVLLFNKKETLKQYKLQLLETNPGKKICPSCNGRGEHRSEKNAFKYIFKPGGGAFKSRTDKIIICKQCNGHGIL